MSNDLEAAIRAARAAINDAIDRRDPDAIAAYLDPAYHVITARGFHRHGREESAKSWGDLFAKDQTSTYSRTPETIHINRGWGMAQEHGRWTGTLMANDGPLSMQGVYAAKWHLTTDGWRLQAEIFTAIEIERPDPVGSSSNS